jgi:exopolyphosphatase / guanosine-5'-triphosphate,3'-diphosphate pyrophosphatase
MNLTDSVLDLSVTRPTEVLPLTVVPVLPTIPAFVTKRPLRRDRGPFAAIDLGSQASLLLIGRIHNGVVQTIHQALALTQVGQSLLRGDRIDDAALARLRQTLADFKRDIDHYEASLVAVGATSAYRRARNGAVVLARLSDELHFPCRPISGEEEAELSWSGVANLYPNSQLTVIDVGSGSTEIRWNHERLSLEMGALTLTLVSDETPEQMYAVARQTFATAFKDRPKFPAWPVVVGGSALALAHLECGMKAYDPESVEGCRISRENVHGWLKLLSNLSPRDRDALPGLDPQRGPILLPGIALLAALADACEAEGICISSRGLRYGLLLEGARRMGAEISVRDKV